MTAQILPFNKNIKPGGRIPVVITFENDNHRLARIPESLKYRGKDELWFEYCRRLWIGVYEANGSDLIKLTVHLNIKDADRMMQEINQWAFYAKQIDGGALYDAVENRLANLSIHNVKFKLDLA